MIKLLKSGRFKLIETTRSTRFLCLGGDVYAWLEPGSLSEIQPAARKIHKTDCVLSLGRYQLYDVRDEPNLSDHVHLYLEVGRNTWQGYMLLSGLPVTCKEKSRIVPTTEKITKTQTFTLQ